MISTTDPGVCRRIAGLRLEGVLKKLALSNTVTDAIAIDCVKVLRTGDTYLMRSLVQALTNIRHPEADAIADSIPGLELDADVERMIDDIAVHFDSRYMAIDALRTKLSEESDTDNTVIFDSLKRIERHRNSHREEQP